MKQKLEMILKKKRKEKKRKEKKRKEKKRKEKKRKEKKKKEKKKKMSSEKRRRVDGRKKEYLIVGDVFAEISVEFSL